MNKEPRVGDVIVVFGLILALTCAVGSMFIKVLNTPQKDKIFMEGYTQGQYDALQGKVNIQLITNITYESIKK